MPKQELRWVQHLPFSFQLENNAGVKCWVSRDPLTGTWKLHFGDMNYQTVSGSVIGDSTFDVEIIKNIAVSRLIEYLRDMIKQLEKFR